MATRRKEKIMAEAKNGADAAHKKLAAQVAAIIGVMKANGFSLPPSLDPPKKDDE